MTRLKTGLKGLDELIGGGIESGSRNILYGPPGTGKTVFAMQFLWEGLKRGETVAYDVVDKPFPRLVAYFKSFGWDVEPYVRKGRFLAIQAFPHFEPYPKDPRVIYFTLDDIEEMKRIDRLISEKKVTRFAAGDFSEQLFTFYDLKYMDQVENWTINWCHFDDIVNIDIMTAASLKDATTQRATDLDLNTAHNIFLFRFNEEKRRREIRMAKIEASKHPLEWIPFEVTTKGIRLLRAKKDRA